MQVPDQRISFKVTNNFVSYTFKYFANYGCIAKGFVIVGHICYFS